MRLALDLSVDKLAGSLHRILSASLLCHFSLSDAGMSGTVSGGWEWMGERDEDTSPGVPGHQSSLDCWRFLNDRNDHL